MMSLKSCLFNTILAVFLFSSCKKEKEEPTTKPDTDLSKTINDSLWAYYPLNGSTNDATGNNHVLALQNGARLSYNTWGDDNGAIELDGINDYGIIQDGSVFPATNFSVSMFVMPRQNKGLFFGKQDYSTAKGASFNVGIDNPTHGNVARFSITENQSQICSQAPTNGLVLLNSKPFYSYAWYHVVMSFNNGVMKFYINGALIGTRQISFQKITACQNGQFILGSWWSGDANAFDGKLDEIRIYTRAISDQEVKYLFDKR